MMRLIADSLPDIPFLPYINLGAIGAILISMYKGQSYTGVSYREMKQTLTERAERAEAKADLAEAKVNELRDKIENEVLPQLFATTDVLAKVTEKISGQDAPK